MKFLVFVLVFLITTPFLQAQDCNGTRFDTTVTCTNPCINYTAKLRNIKSTDDYTVVQIPYYNFPFSNADGNNAPANIYNDDNYSNVINMPFPFCFYGSFYNQFVFGSNGIVTFDLSNANRSCAWPLRDGNSVARPIPYSGGVQGSKDNIYYPKASIMGVYHDIDPSINNGGRKIEWKVFGTAPCRRVVINFNNIAMFNANTIRATHQIVLHENTGIIDINIADKRSVSTWNAGLAILGIQNFNRNGAVFAPGKNCTVWQATNQSYRFYPNGASNYLIDSKLYDPAGNLVKTLLPSQVTFNNDGTFTGNFGALCAPVSTNQYIIKSKFAACFNAASIIEFTDTIKVIKPVKLASSVAVTPTPCGFSQGVITVGAVNNGMGPFTYSIVGGAGPQASNVFNNLGVGNYKVVISNGNTTNCNDTINATISSIITYTVSAITTNANCIAADGTITLTPSLPGTYSYSIDNGVTYQASNVFNVTAGSYTLFTKNSANCVVQSTVTVNLNANNLSVSTVSTQSTCTVGNNGTITATPSPAGTYTFSINNGVSFQAGNIFNVSAGIYNIIIKDAAGCRDTSLDVEVTAINDLTATLSAIPTTCALPPDGKITVTIPGGNLGYTFALNSGTFGTSNILTAGQGPNIVTISKNNCNKDFNIDVPLNNNFIFTLSDTLTKCANANRILDATSNFASNTTLLWVPNQNITSETALNPITNTTNTIVYTVTATYGDCSVVDSVYINVLDVPTINAGSNDTICFGNNGQLNGNVSGNFSSYFWTPTTFLASSNNLNTAVIAPNKSMNYILNARDNYNCGIVVSDTMRLEVLTPIVFNLPDSLVVASGFPTPIPASIINPSAPLTSYTFLWTPSFGLSSTTIIDPIVTLNAPQKFYILGSLNTCIGIDSIKVIPYKGPDIYIPTAFVPDSKRGVNNMARAFYVGVTQLKYFAIYNRWGQRVFNTNDQLKGWDGKINGVAQPTGTYVVVAEGLGINGKVIKKQQTITLIR
jgi:hypothetical protein